MKIITKTVVQKHKEWFLEITAAEHRRFCELFRNRARALGYKPEEVFVMLGKGIKQISLITHHDDTSLLFNVKVKEEK